MKLTKDQLLSAMERSYDYYSARAVLPEVLEAAGLAGKTELEAGEIARLCDVLSAQARHAATLEAIRAATGISPKPVAAAAAPATDPKAAAEKAAAEKAAAEKAAAEKPAPEKPAAEKPAPAKGEEAGPTQVVVALTGVPEGATDVLIVGGHALFGDWKIEGGLALAGKKGVWKAKIPLPAGAEVEFKFVARVADGEAWEGGDNRKLTAGAGETRLETAWQA